MFTSHRDIAAWIKSRPKIKTPDGEYYVCLESLDYDWFGFWFTARLTTVEPPPSYSVPKAPGQFPRVASWHLPTTPLESARFYWTFCRWLLPEAQIRQFASWLEQEAAVMHRNSELSEANHYDNP